MSIRRKYCANRGLRVRPAWQRGWATKICHLPNTLPTVDLGYGDSGGNYVEALRRLATAIQKPGRKPGRVRYTAMNC